PDPSTDNGPTNTATASPPAAGTKSDDPPSVGGSGAAGSTPAEVGWGIVDGVSRSSETKVGGCGEDGGGGDDTRGQDRKDGLDEVGACCADAANAEEDALMFGLQAAAAGTARDQQPPSVPPPPPPRRATSQDPAVTADDDEEDDDGLGEEEEGAAADDAAAALTAKIEDLTLSADAVGLEGPNPDEMLPRTPVPDVSGGGALAGAARQQGAAGFAEEVGGTSGDLRPAGGGEEGSGTGGEVAPAAGVVAAAGVAADHPAAMVVGDVEELAQKRDGLTLTPPPWEANQRRDLPAAAAVSSLPPPPAAVAASSLPSGASPSAFAPAPPARAAALA
ncbi:unnamed protein product, partial [Ectocarpus sp. 12 AP-2014]